MGQVNSAGRARNAGLLPNSRHSLENVPSASEQAHPASEPPASQTTAGSSGKQPRRSSIRRSIFRRVNPASPTATQESGEAGPGSQWWRKSQRWSRTALKRLSVLPSPEDPDRTVDGGREQSRSPAETSSSYIRSAEADLQIARAQAHAGSQILPISDSRFTVTDNAPPRLEVNGNHDLAHGSDRTPLILSESESREAHESHIEAEPLSDTNATSSNQHEVAAATTSPSPSSTSLGPGVDRGRSSQFSPSGTLVVVQGLVQTLNSGNIASGVHATDRRTNEEHTAAQGLQQDNVMTEHTSDWSGPDIVAEQSNHNTERVPLDTDDSTAIGSPGEGAAPAPRRRDITDAGISSGVDMLNTLLSAATALTAASLLANTHGRHSALDSIQPALTDSIGGNLLNSLATPTLAQLLSGSLSGMGLTPPESRQRLRDETQGSTMRSLWGGLRERIVHGRGRGPSVWPHTAARDSFARDRRTRESGEVTGLLRELSLAFSPGRTSPEARHAPSASSDDGGSGREAHEDGPDGSHESSESFEQFLMDVQSNLRTALTQMREHSNAYSISRPTSNSTDSNSAAPSSRTDINEGDIPVAASRSSNEIYDDQPSEGVRGASDNDFAPTEEARSTELGQAVPGISHPVGDPSPANGDTNFSGRNVNWWRLYQFPATTAPRQAVRSSDSLQTVTTLNGPTGAVTDVPSTSSPQGAEQFRAGDLLVPVVVVGLRSAMPGVNRPGTPDTTSGASIDVRNESALDGPLDDGNTSGAGSMRRRRWPPTTPRSLNRPGRRNSLELDDQEQEAMIDGSSPARSFFIYVFGGYVPPGHHILTANASLNSFEAIWELAEILEQTKRPVATEEDIQRSGLQTFKASAIEEFGRNGKVASNCLDGCLICLDNYEPDDDLRLLSCRHAYHRICVDRWLKEGRNSCPACRNRGVTSVVDYIAVILLSC